MKPLLYLPNLLIIGGSSRNVGKTTLSLNLLKKYAGTVQITGLKVTSIRPGEDFFHGNHHDSHFENYQIFKESNTNGEKDTARMLRAGAENVFYIESTDEYLSPAFDDFLAQKPDNGPIICESRSLRNIVKPGLFVLLKHYNPDLIKPGFASLEAMADITFTIGPDKKTSARFSEQILWDGNSWQLSRF